MKDFFNNLLYITLGVILGVTLFSSIGAQIILANAIPIFIAVMSLLVIRDTYLDKAGSIEKVLLTLIPNLVAIAVIVVGIGMYVKYLYSIQFIQTVNVVIVLLIVYVPVIFLTIVFTVMLEFLDRYLKTKS